MIYFILVLLTCAKNLRSILHFMIQIAQLLRRPGGKTGGLFERTKPYVGLKGHLFLLHTASKLK